MKIEWDKEKNCIRIGKCEFTEYKKFKSCSAFADYVIYNNDDIELRPNYEGVNLKKWKNKAYADALKCTPSVLFKHFQKLQNKVFLAPVFHLYPKVAHYKPWIKGVEPFVVNTLNKQKELLQPVYEDGLYNILPVVAVLNKSPQELKKEYGKAWKSVAKNSNSKNKYLSRAIICNRASPDKIKQLFSEDIPSTLLKNCANWGVDFLSYAKKHMKGSWGKPEELEKVYHTLVDTKRLAEQLGEKFNLAWSPRRMKEEHDRMSHELTARRFSPVPFEWTKDLPQVIEHEGYVATLLNSRLLIAEEGTAMGHCVAGYAEQVAQGDYLVYSVTKDGERESTVGIYLKQVLHYELNNSKPTTETKYWELQQHYRKYNRYVTEQAEKEIGNKIVEALNLYEKEKSCTPSS